MATHLRYRNTQTSDSGSGPQFSTTPSINLFNIDGLIFHLNTKKDTYIYWERNKASWLPHCWNNHLLLPVEWVVVTNTTSVWPLLSCQSQPPTHQNITPLPKTPFVEAHCGHFPILNTAVCTHHFFMQTVYQTPLVCSVLYFCILYIFRRHWRSTRAAYKWILFDNAPLLPPTFRFGSYLGHPCILGCRINTG